jgi:hypothetical protein
MVEFGPADASTARLNFTVRLNPRPARQVRRRPSRNFTAHFTARLSPRPVRQVRRRPSRQKQNQARASARARKIPVSIHWKAQ